MGSGVLYGKRALLDAMPPYMGGGSMIRKVDDGAARPGPTCRPSSKPARRRSAMRSGSASAVDYLKRLGMERDPRARAGIDSAYALARLAEVPGLTRLRPDGSRALAAA